METTLRIAVFSLHSSPVGKLGTRYNGGMSVYVRELSAELGRRGHAVDIYTAATEEHPPGTADLDPGVRLIHLAPRLDGTGGPETLHAREGDFLQALERLTDPARRRYDLMHSHYWLSGSLAERVRQAWNRPPHMIMFHTLGAVKNRSHPEEHASGLRLRTESALAQSCSRILAATEKEKALIQRHCGAAPEKISVVPCGVNLGRFPLGDRSAARARLGFPLDRTILLFVGRFTHIKGIDRLVSAMAHLNHRPELRLVLVGGDGPEAPETLRLKDQARELGVSERVTFAGRVEQDRLPDHYAAANALVIPSAHESFGLVALEALASGTPVLATPVGIMETLLRDGTLGSLLTDTDPPRLAESIDRFFLPAGLGALPAARIREAVRPYAWSAVADAVLAEYTKALGPVAPRPGTAASRATGGPS